MKTVLISIALVVIYMMQYGDAQITGWTVPPITANADGTGTLTIAEDFTPAATGTTYEATPTGTDTIASYTLSPAGTPFSIDNSGVLTLDSALDYETTASYTLTITATDSEGNTGDATITVTVTDVDEDPVFASTQYAATVPDASTEDTAVTTVMATDPQEDTLTYSISAGDTNGHFKIASTGAISVNTGATLAASTLAGYSLTVTASDGSNTGTTTVWIAVTTCSSGSVLLVASLITLLAALLTTML